METKTIDKSRETKQPEEIPRFRMGHCYLSRGAGHALQEAGQSPAEFLERHNLGDWGEVCQQDWQANDDAVENGGRVLSAYNTRKGEKLWVITEANRHCTTILLPEEY